MEIASALAEQLRALCDHPSAGDRIAAGLSGLGRDVLDAVPSCVAVSLRLDRFGAEIMVSVLLADSVGSDVAASLTVPLSATGWGDALISRASTAGAFLLLADDLQARLGADRPEIQLDRHLTMPPPETGEALAAALAELSAVNQGIGVLIARGLSPEAARRDLEALASAAGVTLAVASDSCSPHRVPASIPPRLDTCRCSREDSRR